MRERVPKILRHLVVLSLIAGSGWAGAARAEDAVRPSPPGCKPVEDSYIVVFNESQEVLETPASELADTLAAAYGGRVRFVYQHAVKGYNAADLDRPSAESLVRDPAVAYAEQNCEAYLAATQPSPPWGLDRIDQRDLPLNAQYNYTSTGSGVHAYVIDSGLGTHNEFSGRVGNGETFWPGTTTTDDCNGHGTHVSGTLAGSTYGVAKDAIIHPVRVFECSPFGDAGVILAGIDWVVGNRALPAVANLSLQTSPSSSLTTAINNLISGGTTVVVAAANSSADACGFALPAIPATIAVAASTIQDSRADLSNFGPCVDLFAPGDGILSAWIGSDTATNTISGTSMASPHVAGVAARYLEANPGSSPEAVTQAILDNATSGRLTNIGSGSPNLLLYSAFLDGSPDTTPPTVSITYPQNQQFVWGSLTIQANASDNVGVTRVEFRVNTVLQCTDTSPPWSCTINVNNFPPSELKKMRARAFDAAGNFTNSATKTVFFVSNPLMTIDQPAESAVVSGSNVRVVGWASDPDQISSLIARIDGQTISGINYGTHRLDVCQARPISDDNCPFVGFEGLFDSRNYSNGPHTLSVTAIDGSGRSTTKTRGFSIDNPPPPPPPPCQSGPTTLCLHSNRFKAQVVIGGVTGQAVPYSDLGGFFWQYGSTNLEVGVKIIDGRPVNGKFWVFHGAVTDQAYTLTITDTQTGVIKTYTKPQGGLCGGADAGAFQLVSGSVTGFELGEDAEAAELDLGPSATKAPCVPNSTTVCLLNNRFQVRVNRGGVAQPGLDLTGQTGSFWFFSADNPEVVAKVIDGTPLNGRHWVFFGSLTDQSYQVVVTDTTTGLVKSYNSPAPYCGLADVAAF